jgi:L-fuculose-phosphate aldolase
MPAIQKLIEICHKVYKNKFVSAFDGNISCRISDNEYLITRSAVCKGDVQEKDILKINSDGNLLEGEGKLSTETILHLFIYTRRKEINSVVHCHPVYATAFAVNGIGLDEHYFPEVVLTMGKVPLCKYGTPSTNELTESLEPFINYSFAFLLQNHGAVTIGKSLDEAYFRMEKLEHTAKTLAVAKLIGEPKSLKNEQIKKLLNISKDTYGISPDERNIY